MDRIVQDLERLWEGGFRDTGQFKVHDFEILDCYGCLGYITSRSDEAIASNPIFRWI